MMHCMEAIQLITPRDNYILDGLVYGRAGAKRGYIFIHGLESSAFSGHKILAPLADGDTQVLYFNNRGHDTLTGIQQVADSKKGYTWAAGGAAREVFTDCTDDIAGAVGFLKERGATDIVLVGHSTGCQKAVYALGQPEADAAVTGAVLLCPMSDYAAMKQEVEAEIFQRAAAAARQLVTNGKPMALLDEADWPEVVSAQRWISLYSGDGPEETFPYAFEDRQPSALQAVRVPVLVLIAGADEYIDRPVGELVDWFEGALARRNGQVAVIKDSLHNLKGSEAEIGNLILQWRSKLID